MKVREVGEVVVDGFVMCSGKVMCRGYLRSIKPVQNFKPPDINTFMQINTVQLRFNLALRKSTFFIIA